MVDQLAGEGIEVECDRGRHLEGSKGLRGNYQEAMNRIPGDPAERLLFL